MAKRHKAMKGQLELLAERQYRSSGQLFQSCPLCGAMNMDTGLERHIASHLVFLALKSLPSFDDGENCGSPDDVSQDSDSESGDSQRRTFPDERLSEQSHISAGDSGPVGDEDDAGSGAPDERSIESPTLSHITIEEFESKAGPGGPESPRGSGNSEPPQVESQVTSSGFLDHDLTLGHDIMVRLPGDTPGQAHQMVASLDTQCKGINLMSSRVWGKLDEEGRGALQSAGDVALRSLSSEKLPVIGVVRGLEWYFKNGFRTYIDDFHIIDMQRFDVLIGSDSIHKNELLMPGLDLQAVTRREGDGLLQPGVGPHQMNKSKGEEGPRRGVRDRIKKWVASSRKDRLSSRDYLD